MDGFKILNFCVTIILLLLLLALILFIRRPEPLKKQIIKTYDIVPNFDISTDQILTQETFESYKIYYVESMEMVSTTAEYIIIDVPGGAFLESAVNLEPYAHLNLPYPVVSFEYPVVFRNRAIDTLEYLERAIKHVQTTKYPNAKLILIGTSAGAYYTTKIINRGNIVNISKMIGICGYYGPASMPENLLLTILDRVYLTSIRNVHPYVCNIIPSSIELLFITANEDFLFMSSRNFSLLNQQLLNVFVGNHTFFSQSSNESTQQAYKLVRNFILSENNSALGGIAPATKRENTQNVNQNASTNKDTQSSSTMRPVISQYKQENQEFIFNRKYIPKN